MFTPRWKGSEPERGPTNDLAVFSELILQVLKDLGSINKELKYSNWLRVIELKSSGLYDECQMREDFKQFGLEE